MKRKRKYIPRITYTFKPGQLVMFCWRERAKLRVYVPDEPGSEARCHLNPGDIGMYLQTIERSCLRPEEDNLYLFGEIKVLINVEWAEGKIVPYEV